MTLFSFVRGSLVVIRALGVRSLGVSFVEAGPFALNRGVNISPCKTSS